MAKPQGLSSFDNEAVKYGHVHVSQTPGPGSYTCDGVEVSYINVNTTSNEGSFAKSIRDLNPNVGESIAPGPQAYEPPEGIGNTPGPKAAFSRASRFPETPRQERRRKQEEEAQRELDREKAKAEAKHTGPRSRQSVLGPSPEPGTVAPAEAPKLPRAKREGPGETSAAPWKQRSPGPVYNTQQSLVKRVASRKGTLSKASRFGDPNEDDSPGPVYLPKTNFGNNGTVVKFGKAPPRAKPDPAADGGSGTDQPSGKRSPTKEVVGRHDPTEPVKGSASPGPGTANDDALGKWIHTAPKYSIASKLPGPFDPSPEEKKNPRPGPGDYRVKTDFAKSKPPAFSFAPPRAAGHHGGTRRAVRSTSPSQGKEGEKGEKKKRSTPSPAPTAVDQPPRKAKIVQRGEDSPGPVYGSIYKNYSDRPNPRCARITGRHPDPAEKLKGSSFTPGPGAYSPEKVDVRYNKPKNPTFSRAERSPEPDPEHTPGPHDYEGGTWTQKTPVRHGVSTQTPNYTAKAEAARRAQVEHAEKESRRHRLARLQMDYPPPEEDILKYYRSQDDKRTISGEGVSASPTHHDRFLVNVWY